MKIDLNTNTQSNFQANVSPKFEKFMRSYINQGENRVKNNYALNQKLEAYKTYGYNDYTINLATKSVAWGTEYSLVATKEGQEIKNGILLIKRNSVKQIINTFLSMNKNYFHKLMKINHKYQVS